MMKKLYLSKSNGCDIEDLLRVKSMIKRKAEILEFRKGKYDPSLLEKAEILIVIGHENSFDNDLFYLGKGTGTEVKRALERNIPAYAYIEDNIFYPITSIKVFDDTDWKYEYYAAYLGLKRIDVNKILNIKNISGVNPLDDILP